MSGCRCGHTKSDHIYEEGACRPGFPCDCPAFNSTDGRSTAATESLTALITSAHRALDDPETVRRLSQSASLPHTARILALHFEVEAARWAEEGNGVTQ